MTITTIAANDRTAGPFTATDGQTVFSFDFPIYDDGDITVTRVRGTTETTLVLDTDYSVTGVEEAAGGTIVLAIGAEEDDEITITGTMPTVRATAFEDGGDLLAADLNKEFNRLVIMAQEVAVIAAEARAEALAAISSEELDAAVEAIAGDVQTSATNAVSFAAAAAASAANAEETLSQILEGGALADAPVSPAMQPVVAASTLAAARTELGLGSMATASTSSYQTINTAALKANNLSDLASASSARSNLGLGALAVAGAGSGLEIVSGNARLTDTGATAAAYGSATKVPVITVDAKGRITAASEVDVSGGAWQRISAGSSTSAVATVDIALPSGYSKYRLELLDMAPATANRTARFRFSTNGGTSYDATSAYDTAVAETQFGGTDSTDDAVDTSGALTVSTVETTARLLGTLEIDTTNKIVLSRVCCTVDPGLKAIENGMTIYGGGSTPTHIRLLFSSGNIARHKWVLTGMV